MYDINVAVRKELFINCGIIEASRDERHQMPYPPSWTELADVVGSTVCTQMYTDYVEAIDQLRSLTEQVLTDVAELSTDDTEKRYVLVRMPHSANLYRREYADDIFGRG